MNSYQPSFTIVFGNFNARSKSWWPDGITSPEGTDIDSLTTVHGLQQLLSEATHLLPNSLYCIDLIFTDQSKLAVESEFGLSLHHCIGVFYFLTKVFMNKSLVLAEL